MKPLIVWQLGRNQVREKRQGTVMSMNVRTTGTVDNMVHVIIKVVNGIKERKSLGNNFPVIVMDLVVVINGMDNHCGIDDLGVGSVRGLHAVHIGIK
jgi:hypothetical protein